jgi:hypothetical protein
MKKVLIPSCGIAAVIVGSAALSAAPAKIGATVTDMLGDRSVVQADGGRMLADLDGAGAGPFGVATGEGLTGAANPKPSGATTLRIAQAPSPAPGDQKGTAGADDDDKGGADDADQPGAPDDKDEGERR